MNFAFGVFFYLALAFYGLYSVFVSRRESQYTKSAAIYHTIISGYFTVYIATVAYMGTEMNKEVSQCSKEMKVFEMNTFIISMVL